MPPIPKPKYLEELLAYKALPPLPEVVLADIREVAAVDVAGFSEDDVRANVIDPIVRHFGYKANTHFSIKRQKPLSVLGGHNFIDYNVMLFAENFWLIEAKKPNKGIIRRKDLLQALQYASHPEVNAALVVLCDGIVLTVFDRETSLSEPLFSTRVADLTKTFDTLRHILDPWAIWFFEKRRIMRLVDKVFDREHSLERADEFVSLIKRRVDGKRATILDNYRGRFNLEENRKAEIARIRSTELREITEVLFFFPHNKAMLDAMVGNLMDAYPRQAFQVLSRLLPDEPRDANAAFHAHSLYFLMHLAERHPSAGWLPTWLHRVGRDYSVEAAVEHLVGCCLTHFRNDTARNCILLLASALRRLAKISVVANPASWRQGELTHLLHRYLEPELDWSQILSSPERYMFRELDRVEMLGTSRIVRELQDDRGSFRSESAKMRLRELWYHEINLLGQLRNYATLVRERDFGEIFPSECVDTRYDYLGHYSLCLIEAFPKWKTYAMNHYRDDIIAIAASGSWQARRMLGLAESDPAPMVSSGAMAERFFLGDRELHQNIILAYDAVK